MIDKDDSGTLDKAEVVDAVKNDKKVIKFLCNCGNQNLQYLLVPSRLDKALAEMDTDRDGSIDADEWEQCIEIALQNKLAARAAKRELDAKNAAKEIAAFTSDFLNAARKCFNLIDKDMSGTLEIDEIVTAVKTDQEVISFLQNCGEENLQFLLQPARLKKALKALDTDGSGEIDVEEWCVTRRPSRFIAIDAVDAYKHNAGRAQGGGDPARPQAPPRAALRGAGAPRTRRGRRRRGLFGGVPDHGSPGLRHDRRRRVGVPGQG